MSIVSELLAANARHAAGFTKGDLPIPPARRLAVLTCMDARLDPARFLGLEVGDAHIIRNAGGRASPDALRSLIISQQLLGTREIVVIHHTGCGMLAFQNAALQQQLHERFGQDAGGIDFLPVSDLAKGVRDDVAAIRQSPFILPETPISGFIYDVRAGRLAPVE